MQFTDTDTLNGFASNNDLPVQQCDPGSSHLQTLGRHTCILERSSRLSNCEGTNQIDRHAIALMKSGEIVGATKGVISLAHAVAVMKSVKSWLARLTQRVRRQFQVMSERMQKTKNGKEIIMCV